MRKRIFIVDDSEIVRTLLRTYLETRLKHVACAEAADGLDAIQRVKEVGPDLIILDFSMPNMNGLEAAAVIHSLLPAVPIVLYTLHKDVVSEMGVQGRGICAVVSKMEPIDAFLGEILKLVGTANAVSA